MTIASYSELLTEMDDWLNRADLDAKIPTFIRLFEARMNRRLRNPDMEVTATQTIIAGQNSYSLPATMRQLKHVFVVGTPNVELVPLPYPSLREEYPDNSSGKPAAYSVVGETIVLQPVPSAAGTLTIIGFQTLSGLGSGNATNWLLDDHPDVYFYGSMAEAFAYERDEEQAAKYKELSEEAMAEIIAEANKRRYPSGPLAARPAVWE